jgi:predicted DNA-binding antitoxin AbrB/MazE fold protein
LIPKGIGPWPTVYEKGAFKPLEPLELQEGPHVLLAVELQGLTPQAADAQLRAWQAVFEGLSEEDIAEVETMARDRSRFLST